MSGVIIISSGVLAIVALVVYLVVKERQDNRVIADLMAGGERRAAALAARPLRRRIMATSGIGTQQFTVTPSAEPDPYRRLRDDAPDPFNGRKHRHRN